MYHVRDKLTDVTAASDIRLDRMLEVLNRLWPHICDFDLSSLEGRAGFLGWWLGHCADKHLGVQRPSDAASAALAIAPVSQAETIADLPITHMLIGAWRGTQQFGNPNLTLDDPVGRLATTVHWYLYWPAIVPGYSLRIPRVERFLATPMASGDASIPLMPAEYLAYRQEHNPGELNWRNPDRTADELRCWYFLSAATGNSQHRCLLPAGMTIGELQAQLRQLATSALTRSEWLASHVGTIADIDALIGTEIPALIARQAAKVRNFDETLPPPAPATVAARPRRGANIVGYVTGELGVGEDARTTAGALLHYDYPFSMVNFPRQSAARQQDLSFACYLRDDNPHDQNIFCFPAVESLVARMELPAAFFEGRRNIGYMPWELEKWPPGFMPALDLLDEVWTISSFLVDGIRAVSKIPVFNMPLAITAEAPGAKQRRDFGLPDDRFLFLFVFDFNSSINRKNPEACLEAFSRAFPRDRRVGLVVKCQSRGDNPERYERFIARCLADERVTLLADTLSRGDTLDLMACCDAFVSLHRSEGFGRCMAEAMALGKPVIATDYSGNRDFCLPDNSCLVQSKMVPVKKEHYWHSAGQVWAEPDVDHAAEWMTRLIDDREFRTTIALAGQNYIRERHSLEAAGSRYLTRLQPK